MTFKEFRQHTVEFPVFFQYHIFRILYGKKPKILWNYAKFRVDEFAQIPRNSTEVFKMLSIEL
jgi:hypothetical protein